MKRCLLILVSILMSFQFLAKAEVPIGHGTTDAFNTNAVAVSTFPWTENFDTYSTGTFPTDWYRPVIHNSYPAVVTAYSVSSPASLRFQSASATVPTYAITPQLDADINTLMVTFQLKAENTTNSGTMHVGVMSSPTDTSTFELVQIITPTNTSFQQYEIMLDDITLTGTGNYIAFKHVTNSSIYYYWLDDVVVDVIPTCFKPTNLAVLSSDIDQLEVGWTENNSATIWNIQYKKVSDNTWEEELVYDNPYTIMNLDPATDYMIRVQSDCGTEESDYSDILTVTTPCLAVETFPYTENFDTYGTTLGTFPTCWFRPVLNTSTPYPSIVTVNNTPPGSLRFQSASASQPTFAITPQLDAELNTLMVTFQLKAESTTSSGVMHVGVMSSPTDTSTFELVQIITPTNTSFQQYEIMLDDITLTGTGNYIAFKHVTNSSSWYYWLDDVVVDVIPTCFKPTNLAVLSSDIDQLEVGWTETGTATSWIVEYKEATATTWQVENAYANPHTIMNLNPATSYDIRVQSDCGLGDISAFSDILIGTTDCVPFDVIPWTESFEDLTAVNTLPPCWAATNLGSYTYTQITNYGSHNRNARTGTAAAYFSYGANDRFFTPGFQLQGGVSYEFSFWYVTDGYSGWNSLEAQVYSAQSPSALLYTIGSATGINNTTYQKLTAYFTPTDDGVYYFGAYCQASGSPWYLTIDDFSLDLAPDCLPLTQLEVSNITGSSAYVTWAPAGTPDYFTVEIEDLSTQAVVYETTNNYDFILTGLNELTNYSVTVYPVCNGQDGTGETVQFRTTCYDGGDIIVGTPSSTNNTNGQYLPTYTFYNYCLTEQIYEASEMSDVGDSIYGLAFQYFFSTSLTRNIEIYLGHTNKTTFTGTSDAVPASSLTMVYQGNVTWVNTNPDYWMEFNFTTPFAYDSDSNLVVVVRDMTGSSTSSDTKFRTHSTSGTKAIYFYQDDGAISLTSPSASNTGAVTSRNNIKFMGECNQVTCIRPNVILTNVDVTSATMTIVPGMYETSWEGEYKMESDSVWTSLGTITYATYILDNLTANTSYQFRVRSDCGGGDYSSWKLITFTTLCGDIDQLPFTENFDTYPYGSNSIPTCWTRLSTQGNCPYITTSYPISNPHSLYFYAYGTNHSTLILPPLSETIDITTLQVRFWARTATMGQQLEVGVMTDPNNIATFTLVGTAAPTLTNTYQEFEVNFHSYTGTGQYIAIRVNGANTLYMDNFLLHEAPSCIRPSDVTFSGITQTEATVSWLPSPTAVSYEYVYGIAGITPDNEIPVAVNDTFVELTGLTESTCYDFYVRAVCAPGDESDWSNMATFCTSQTPVNVPFTIDFETASGFTFANNTSGNNWYIGSAADVNNTTGGSNGLYISNDNGVTNAYSNTSAVVWAFRDIYFTPSTDDYTLSFDWKCYGEGSGSYPHDFFNVYIGAPVMPVASTTTTITPPTGATALGTNLNQQMSWYSQTYTLSAATYSGQTMRLYYCWKNDGSVANQPPVAIDNIEITSTGISVCLPPTNLAISNIDANGATATWGGTATSWVFEYKTAAATTWTTQAVTTQTYTMTGLQPSTDYETRVKAICDAGEESAYSAVVSFTTTAPPCVVPTNLAISNISSTGATATWTAGGSETSWQIEYKTASAGTWTTQTVNNPTYTMTGLQPSTNYQVRVKSLCGSGIESPYTTVVSFTTAAPPCVVPTNLAISNVSSTGATATWTAGGSETSWQIEYKTASAGTWTTQTVNNPTYNITGLQPTTAYQVRVKSLCGSGSESAYTNVVSFTTAAPPCVAPTNLTISNISSSEATATWTAGGSETSWQIEYKAASSGTWTTQTVNNPTYTMTGLQPSTNYQVRVKSLCGSGIESAYTTVVSFTTAAPPCVVPTNLAISNVSSIGATATWTAGGSETSWQIEYKLMGATDWTTQTVTTPTYTMTGLQPSTDYQTRVKAICDAGEESDYTTVVSFTTTAPPCVAPTNLTISNISSSEATATWTAGGSETSWQIEYKAASSGTWTTQTVNNPTYTMTGLQPTTAYQVRVKSLCGSGIESAYTTVVSFTTAAPPCVVPTNLAISNVSSIGATATWTAGGSETSWQIEYKAASSGTWTTQTVNNPTYNITGLQPTTAYQVRVKSLCGSGSESAYTNVVSFTTAAPPCVVPTNLAISNISSTGATATWTAGGSETSWQIEYKTASAGTWTTQTVNNPTYNITGLQPTTAYQVRVKSLCGSGSESAYTNVVSFTTAAPPCVVPTNLAISNISSTGATATWTAGGSETSWQIEYKTASAGTWTTQTVNNPTYNITGLQPTTAYQVRVKSLCGSGSESAYTNVVSFRTAAPPCVVPTNLAISNVSSTGATATWTAGGSETSWQIEYKAASSGTWTTQTVNNPTYNITGLQPTTAYQVRVKSLCGSGVESAYTTVVSFTTAAPPCVVPTNLAISNVSSTEATATWTAGGSETSWQIEYKAASSGTWTTQTVNNPTYTMTGLQPSTNYQVRVKSLCGSGIESAYTTVVSFTTAAPPCVVPTNLAISNVSSIGATATWTAGGSETSWQIEYKLMGATDWTTQTVTTPTYTMTGLQPSTDYQTRVKAICDAGEESDYTTVVSFTTTAPPCVAPTNLTISNISSSEATATWTAGGSETSWQIEYKAASSGTWTTQTVNNPTYIMTGLQPTTAYQVRVKSLCGSGSESAYTNVVSFTTAAPPCVVPTNLAISNVSSTGATATWTAGGSETSWQIEYKAASSGTWTTQTVNNPTYNITGLQPTTAYQVRVKSLCGSGVESAYTTVVSFTTAAPPCVVPTNLAISNVSSTEATATWTAGGSETSWQIEYKAASSGTWTTQTVNNPTYNITGLQPTTAYQVRVKSLCGSGSESAYTNVVSFTTAAPPCVVPTNLAISNVSSTGATATWTAGGSETSWQIEYKTASAGTWTTQTVNNPTYNITGLQPTTAYQVRVKSLCGSGIESAYTTVVSFTTAAPPCVVPTNLAISNVSSIGATATWTAGGSETSWQIEYKLMGATDWTTQTVTTPTYTMTGLQPSTDYQTRVKAICDAGEESDYTTVVSFTTTAPPCVAPTNLTISNISSSEATATWTAGGSETSWQIEYKAASSGTWTTQTVNNPTYIMTGLQPTTAYQVRVKSLCGSGSESVYTTVVSFTTAAPPCVVPTNLAISNISSTGATATWTAGGSETSWQIEYKTASAGTWTTQTVNNPTYTMTGLQPSTNYQVRVKSLCGSGIESPYTTVVSFTTAAPPCVVPTNLAISNVSSTGATATWTAGGSETSWQIEYKTASAGTWTTQTVNNPTYNITGLQPTTAYQVRVKSLCGSGSESAYTNVVSFTTAAPPCVVPTNLAISNVSSTGATATWTAGGSETSWQIEYKAASSGTWTTQTVNNPTYNITGLQPTTAYQVRVKSLCGSGVESAYTTVVSFTTAAPPCVVPTNLAISNVSSTEATATWTAGGSETSWQIEYKTASAGTWTTQTVNNPTYNITGLQPTTAYQVRVKSLCGSGSESAYTNVVSFTTAAPPCVVPTNLAISNVSSTGATATWIAGGTETSWEVEYKIITATTWTAQIVTTPSYTMTGLQPSTDYEVRVKSLCDDGEESGYTESVTFTTEELPTYTILATAGPNGTINPSGTVIVNENETQTFIFIPEAGYRIDVVLVDDVPQVPVPESYTFEYIQANHTIHVDFTEGIDENELSQYVTLYPNPTRTFIDMELDKDYLGATECRIYDMYGKLMRVFHVEEEITSIDVSDFAAGVYLVRLTTEQGQVSKRFVKQ